MGLKYQLGRVSPCVERGLQFLLFGAAHFSPAQHISPLSIEQPTSLVWSGVSSISRGPCSQPVRSDSNLHRHRWQIQIGARQPADAVRPGDLRPEMEAVPAAEALDGHKDRFDLGVFVGDLALDEEVTRYSRSRHVLSLPFYGCDSEACPLLFHRC
jgi:hypothetical protein